MDGLRGAARNLSSENEPWSARDQGFLLPASTSRDPPIFKPVLPGDVGLEGREAWMPRCQLAGISSAGSKAESKIAAIACHYFPSRQATAESHVARPVWHYRPAIGRCFCCFLQQNISQVSVVRLRLAGFSIGMRLRKQQRTWLFLAVFERARPAADRKCMAAGDYQFDSEIASHNSYLSNCLESRSGAWPSLCHAPQTAASGGNRSSGRAPTLAWQRLNPIRGSARGQP